MTTTGKHSVDLARAQALARSQPAALKNESGEFEGAEWWEEHAALFKRARRDYGTLYPELYDLKASASEFIDPRLLSAVTDLERAAASGGRVDEGALRALFQPAADGVWRFPLFTPRFCELMLAELAHAEASGVPLRRPNGMNRFGAILEELPGGLGFERTLRYLSHRFLRPLSQMLYPWLVAADDADEHYGFVVRYKVGEDVALAQHADASVATLNVNLGVPGFTGGALHFRGVRFVDERPEEKDPPSRVDFADFAQGEAILHLGGQYHSALPLESGERVNLVVWLFGEHGVVRVAPHDPFERLSAHQRWAAAASEDWEATHDEL